MGNRFCYIQRCSAGSRVKHTFYITHVGTEMQRPYLFRFSNYRPITGSAEFMYQNITIMPLPDFTGQIDYVAILIYDVTDQATNTLANKA